MQPQPFASDANSLFFLAFNLLGAVFVLVSLTFYSLSIKTVRLSLADPVRVRLYAKLHRTNWSSILDIRPEILAGAPKAVAADSTIQTSERKS